MTMMTLNFSRTTKSAIFACFTFAFAAADGAHAQLEKLLAPVIADSAPIDLAAQESKLVAAIQQNVPAENGSSSSRANAHVLRGEDLLGVLQKQLAEHFHTSGDLKLELLRPFPPVKLPDSAFDVAITDFPGAGLTNAFLLRVKVTSLGEPAGEWQIALGAQLWQEVWVAQARLDRGKPLDRALLTVQKVDVLRDRQAFLPAEVDPTTYDVAQSIAPGRAVTRRDISERPIIRKDQVVEVVAVNRSLTIHMKAQALENGAANAVIKLRNLDNRKEFNAQVINENQVRVAL